MKMPDMCPFEKKRKIIFFYTNNFFFSGTKQFCPRKNFCSVFYGKAKKEKKNRSDPKILEFFFP